MLRICRHSGMRCATGGAGFHDVGHVPQLARTYDGTARGLRKLPAIKGMQAKP